MSALVFAGGAQFAAVGVLASGGSAVAAVVSGLVLNLRYLAFGAAVAPRLQPGALRRALAAHLLVDESAALALAEPDRARAERVYWACGASIFVAWNVGSFLGARFGDAVGDPAVLGLDAALPAALMAMVAPQLSSRAARISAGAGAAVAVGLSAVASAGVATVGGGLGAVVALLVARAGR